MGRGSSVLFASEKGWACQQGQSVAHDVILLNTYNSLVSDALSPPIHSCFFLLFVLDNI